MSDKVPHEWRRPALPLAVLALLAKGDRHGYALIRELQTLGFDEVSSGTVYPLLARVEASGFVTARWDEAGEGPARRTFGLTARGALELRSLAREWRTVVSVLEPLTAAVPDGGHHEL